MSRVTISMKAARALEAWRKWFGARLDRITKNGTAEDYSGYEMDLFDATTPEPKRKPRKPLGVAELAGAAMPSVVDPYIAVAKARAEKRRKDAARKAQKRERRASIREAVAKRAADAGGWCECGCGEQVFAVSDIPEARGEMDHFWGCGKGRPPESLETCWFLRLACHLAKTRSQPDAATWLRKFIEHCRSKGYFAQRVKAESRLRFVEARSALPAAPRLNR